MEVAEGIHLIKCPFSTYFVSSCAIVGKSIALIDAGVTESPEVAIYPYLRSIGREPSEISHILLTHAHFDHCGGVAPIKRETRCKVGVHELGKTLLEDAGLIDRQLRNRFPNLFQEKKPDFESTKVDIALRDGDTIDLDGDTLRVLHVPGHSACSSCFVDDEQGVYICGDSVQGRGERRPLLFHSSTEYLKSMRRLIKEPIKLLINGHPFPPFNKAVLEGRESREHVSQSLRSIEELNSLVWNTLKTTRTPMSPKQMHERIGMSQPVTIGCILEALEKENKVERVSARESDSWAAKV